MQDPAPEPAAYSHPGLADPPPRDLTLEVVSDAICPWCWIGKRRLEAAAALLPQVRLRLRWQPFLLNPGMPAEGLDRRAYRSAKFGSWERAAALDARVAAAGAEDGLEFRHDLMRRTPDTRPAHRLIRLAGAEGDQDATVEALFRAYFNQGQDIGDPAVLAACGRAGGLPAARVAALLAGQEGVAEITSALEAGIALGIDGVPTVLLDGQPLFAGALPPATMAAALREALRRRS